MQVFIFLLVIEVGWSPNLPLNQPQNFRSDMFNYKLILDIENLLLFLLLNLIFLYILKF